MREASPRISALIVARDEAENLADCLASLSWVDETIVVVDALSQDATEAIARSLATRVVVRTFDDFAHQRNASLEIATGDWVFAVDADERATPELAGEIRRTLADVSKTQSGYRVPIRSVVLGQTFRYSGTQHDLPLRLFRREQGRWVGTVHETVELSGSVGQLAGHLTHRTIPDMQTFLRKINHYTTLEAIKFHREGRPFRLLDLTIRPFWTFFKLYLGKQGFRDGLEGLAFCALSGLSVAVRHWKLRELIAAERVHFRLELPGLDEFDLTPSLLAGEGRGGGTSLVEQRPNTPISTQLVETRSPHPHPPPLRGEGARKANQSVAGRSM
jgi:glycosyltransferase involved in cell wall biosynthesis